MSSLECSRQKLSRVRARGAAIRLAAQRRCERLPQAPASRSHVIRSRAAPGPATRSTSRRPCSSARRASAGRRRSGNHDCGRLSGRLGDPSNQRVAVCRRSAVAVEDQLATLRLQRVDIEVDLDATAGDLISGAAFLRSADESRLPPESAGSGPCQAPVAIDMAASLAGTRPCERGRPYKNRQRAEDRDRQPICVALLRQPLDCCSARRAVLPRTGSHASRHPHDQPPSAERTVRNRSSCARVRPGSAACSMTCPT